MAKHQGIWDDWVSLRERIWLGTLDIQPAVLDSVSRSPLYSIYGEAIAGVTIIRAFGASTKFLRDMLRCVDTVCHFFSYPLNSLLKYWAERQFLLLDADVYELPNLFLSILLIAVVRSESLARSPLQSTFCCCHWGNWIGVSRYSKH